jgi:hypothetical protein
MKHLWHCLPLVLLAVCVGCERRPVTLTDSGLPDGPPASGDTFIALLADGPALPADGPALLPDGGAAFCATNADCPSDQYCQVDGLCVVTGAMGGTCTPRPELAKCPDWTECPDVCGCDGKTYCAACEAHAAGVSVAHDGPCLAPTCAALDVAYAAEVAQAKQCCPLCNSIQCATVVTSNLGCGCDTYINGSPTAKMKALQSEWTTRGCQFTIGCPPKPCDLLFGATCEGTGATGTCKDVLAD